MSARDSLSQVQFEMFMHQNSGAISAYHPALGEDQEAGMLDWTDQRINSVWVHPEVRRQGLATRMLRHAEANGVNLQHNDERTDAGEAWARSVGAPPRRSSVRWDNSLYPED